jgi:hypothetical protein
MVARWWGVLSVHLVHIKGTGSRCHPRRATMKVAPTDHLASCPPS